MGRADRQRRTTSIAVSILVAQVLAMTIIVWWMARSASLTAGTMLVIGALALSNALPWCVILALARWKSRIRKGIGRIANNDAFSNDTKALAHTSHHNDLPRDLQPFVNRFHRLEQQSEEFKSILRSMSSGMIVLDLDHHFLHVNRAAERLFEIDEDHVRGRLFEEVIRDAALHQFVAKMTGADDREVAEFTVHRPREVAVQVLAEPLRPTAGQPVGLLLLMDDVTELRRLERIRSDFAANVSHELRTPITSIQGYVETLFEVGFSDEDQARRFLDVIKRNAERLGAIIDDLLALSALERSDAGEAIERVNMPLRTLVCSTVRQFHDSAQEKAITLTTKVDDLLCAPINHRLLEQALSNLLANAIKYSPPETTVTVSACGYEGGRICINVTDEGPGIAAEHLPRVFERFYRVDQARSRELGGTGLGLAIVKHIALAHGGSVDVDSEVGRGSTFRIILPGSARTPQHAD